MTRTLGASAETQGMGMGGMRAPMGGAKPLGQAPALRPVKAPIAAAQPGVSLPKPLERQVRTPIQPQAPVPVVQPTQELPAEEIVVPVGAVEVSITPGDDGQFGTSDDEARISKRDLTEIEEVMEEVVEEVVEAEVETTTLRPVQGTLTPLNVVAKETAEVETETALLRPVQRLTPISTQPKEVKTASIKPVLPQMIPKDEDSSSDES
jgi:hypothetical protein